ncbi:unnamed protein product [Rhizoctonia solani]|uniref:Transmembrane protein n=1 Tax=Rhizoctonia solani TaxID=456999 RepID=A0A8H2XA50_9AGAM|nr:unnamed protein product [Rhizoctonia solani]
MPSHILKPEPPLSSHFKRSLPEQISQSSSGSSRSVVAPSSTSSRKQVTWGKSTMAKNPMFPVAHRKVHSTLDYLKHRLRQVESERSIGPLFKRRQTGAHKPLQGILKPPTPHFPEDQADLRFDWTEFQDEFGVYATDSLVPPLLDTPSDITEDTPTESTTSTPPEPISPCESWDTSSEYWSDQWDETPELPSGWSPPLDYFTISQMEVESSSDISEQTKPVQLLHQPVDSIQTPGEFVEEVTSSLQYGLIVCGLGFMAFLFLACWTILLITCGVMIASVFPAVLVAYGFMLLFASTKCSIEWLLMTTLKIGGGLTLAIGIGLVVIVEFVGDIAFTLFRKLAGTLPTVVFLGTLSIALFTQLEANNNSSNVLANSTEQLTY